MIRPPFSAHLLEAPGARAQGDLLYLWSSPYDIWKYKALRVDVYLSAPVYVVAARGVWNPLSLINARSERLSSP